MSTGGVQTVLTIWQDAVGHMLSPERRTAFLERPEVRALRNYPSDVLAEAARETYDRCQELRLTAWRQAAVALVNADPTRFSEGPASPEDSAPAAPTVPPPPTGLRARSGERRRLLAALPQRDLEGPGIRGAPTNQQTHRRISQTLGETPPYK